MLDQAILQHDVAQVTEILRRAQEENSLSNLNRVHSKSGFAPIHLCCLGGNPELIELLVVEGHVNLINEDAKGRLPLHCAVESRNVDAVRKVVELLQRRDADQSNKWLPRCIKVRDLRGWTPLHLAVFGSDSDASFEMVKFLVQQLPQPCQTQGSFLCKEELPKQRRGSFASRSSKPPKPERVVVSVLHKAAVCGSARTVAFLLENIQLLGLPVIVDEYVNEQDVNGLTPLLVACVEGHRDVAKVLIDFGADLTHCDHDGQTAAHCAFSMGHIALGDWLLSVAQQGSVLESKTDNEGKSALDWRLHSSNFEDYSSSPATPAEDPLPKNAQDTPPRPPLSPVNSPTSTRQQTKSPKDFNRACAAGTENQQEEKLVSSLEENLDRLALKSSASSKWLDDRESLRNLIESDMVAIHSVGQAALSYCDNDTADAISSKLNEIEQHGYWEGVDHDEAC